MMIQLDVEVQIRKGLSAEFITKIFPVGFDDLPDDTQMSEVKRLAKDAVENYLRSTEDYPLYGKNWIITDYHYT